MDGGAANAAFAAVLDLVFADGWSSSLSILLDFRLCHLSLRLRLKLVLPNLSVAL